MLNSPGALATRVRERLWRGQAAGVRNTEQPLMARTITIGRNRTCCVLHDDRQAGLRQDCASERNDVVVPDVPVVDELPGDIVVDLCAEDIAPVSSAAVATSSSGCPTSKLCRALARTANEHAPSDRAEGT